MQYNFSDEELIEKFLDSGDPHAFSQLFEKYKYHVFGICLGYTKNEEICKDLTMMVFEKLLRRENLNSVAQFKNWLLTVTKNTCLDYLRSRKRYQARIAKVYEDQTISWYVNESPINFQRGEAEKANDSSKLIQKEELNTAIDQLSATQRECMCLFYFDRKSYKEIQSITGYPISTIKSNLQNGRRNLKKLLERMN